MDIMAWDIGSEIDNETESEEIKLAQSLLDEARLSYAYARLAALIDAICS